jgi:predicted transcriptional regulator of viral defense system
MAENVYHYSQSQGLKLLDAAVTEFGPLFTLDQIRPLARALNLSDSNLHYLMSMLANGNWIVILKRGTYLVKSPLYAEEVPAYAIAASLVQPMAISHWSACMQHGFTTQNPTMVQASTPKKVVTPEMRAGKANSPRGRAVWTVSGHNFEFIFVSSKRFWGFERIWVNSWQQVNITDHERTALDLIARPDIFGGTAAAIEILENAIGQIKIDRLIDYALKYDTGSVIKRLGWALEKLGIADSRLEELQSYPVKRYYPLDPTRGDGIIKNNRWHILENLRGL